MNCEQCGITLRGNDKICPLCDTPVIGAPDGRTSAFPNIVNQTRRYKTILSLFAFASIAAAAICFAVNLVLSR